MRGPVEIDTATMSDPVLVREDGAFLYTLPSVADDIDMGISHVVRGEDHVTNTAAQIEIFQALGASVPKFAHFPIVGRRGRGGAEQAARVRCRWSSCAMTASSRWRWPPISPRSAPPIPSNRV